jgi:Rrf2 family protein
MNITARLEYACLAMMELAGSHELSEPVTIKKLADTHGIPAQYLVQILLQLKQAGLVRSTRGASGGYQLARPPERISLADICEALDQLPRAFTSTVPSSSAAQRVLSVTWNRLLQGQYEHLRSINLAQLDRQARDQTAGMYYI